MAQRLISNCYTAFILEYLPIYLILPPQQSEKSCCRHSLGPVETTSASGPSVTPDGSVEHEVTESESATLLLLRREPHEVVWKLGFLDWLLVALVTVFAVFGGDGVILDSGGLIYMNTAGGLRTREERRLGTA